MLGGYLAGLIEGDGSIIVPKSTRNEKGKLLYPVVKITFVAKDLPLALKIQKIFKGGNIEHPKGSNYINLLFQDVGSIQKIFKNTIKDKVFLFITCLMSFLYVQKYYNKTL